MTVYWRKLRGELSRRWLSHLLIMAVLAAAAAALTVALMLYRSTDRAFESLFAAARGAHIWFMANGSAAPLDVVRGLGGVVESSGTWPSAWDSVRLAAQSEELPLALWGLPAEPLAVGRPVVTSGRWLADEATSEIVLDAGLANALGLQPGDEVELVTAHGHHRLRLVGVAVSTARPSYPASQPALGYVLPDALALLEPDRSRWTWLLGVRLFVPDATGLVIRQVQEQFASQPELRPSATPWQWVRDELRESTQFEQLLFGIFGAFALLAASVVLANLVVGATQARRREMGLLKAIGLTRGQVAWLLALEYTGLSLAAGLVGAGLGAAIAPALLHRRLWAIVALTVPALDLAVIFGVAAGLALFSLAIVLGPAWRGAQMPVVEALLPPRSVYSRSPAPVAVMCARLRLPPALAVGLGDVISRPLRAAFTASALGVAVITSVFTLSAEATFRAAAEDPTVVGGPPYRLEVRRFEMGGRETLSHAETEALLQSRPEVDVYLTQHLVSLRPVGGGGREPLAPGFTAFALGGEYSQFRYYLAEGRMFAGPGEAVVTGALADRLGVSVGDEVTFMVQAPANGGFMDTGRTLTLRIVGRYVSGGDGGRRLLFSLDTYRQIVDPSAEPTYYGLKLRPGTDVEALQAELARLSADRLEVIVHDLREGVGGVRVLLLGLASMLLGLAAANLLTTLLLAVRERQREFGLLKALGFVPREIVASVLAGSLVLALLAIAAGVPLGLGLTRLLFDIIGRQLRVGSDVFALPDAAWLGLVVPITLLATLAASLWPARRAAGIRIVEALHYE